jgi:hypothetical protein
MSEEEVYVKAKEWREKFCSLDLGMPRSDVHKAMGRPTAIFRQQVENFNQVRNYNFDEYHSAPHTESGETHPVLIFIAYDVDDTVEQLMADIDSDVPCDYARYEEEVLQRAFP